MKAKKLLSASEELDMNIPLVVSELDTDPNRLYCFDNTASDLTPDDTIGFEKTFSKISEEGTVITNINDNTELIEYGDDSVLVILYCSLEHKIIIVDLEDAKIIRKLIKQYSD